MFDQMDIEGASILRLVSPGFRDTFQLKDALQYVTMFLNNIVHVYGHLDSIKSISFSDSLHIIDIVHDSIHKYISENDVNNFINADNCIEIEILVSDDAPPVENFLHNSQLIFKELFSLLAYSTNGKYYTRYNTIHIIEMRIVSDFHFRLHIKNSTHSATIYGEFIGARS